LVPFGSKIPSGLVVVSLSLHQHSSTKITYPGPVLTRRRPLSMPRIRLCQERDPARGTDTSGSATCVSSSAHCGVSTCAHQNTAGLGAWLFCRVPRFHAHGR
jgi:hypothetical protein